MLKSSNIHVLSVALFLLQPVFALDAARSKEPQPAAKTTHHVVGADLDKQNAVARQEYMNEVSTALKKHWEPADTNSAIKIKTSWKINKDGTVSDARVLKPSADKRQNAAVLAAIKNAAPFAPIPKGAGADLEIEFNFEQEAPIFMTREEAVAKFGVEARNRLQPIFAKYGVTYPPSHSTWICLKREQTLNVFAPDKSGKMKLLLTVPFTSSSGSEGPKLSEGDLQIPEGFYKIVAFKGLRHLALCLNYPNETDRKNAALDGRTRLGDNIQIHGGRYSTGCVVVSTDAMKDLFVLASDIGRNNISVVMAPCNLNISDARTNLKKYHHPKLIVSLYEQLKNELRLFPL